MKRGRSATSPFRSQLRPRSVPNWGGGNFSSYAAGTASASHVYSATGTAEIQETAIGPDGTAYNFPAVPLDISAAGVTAVPLNNAASSSDVFEVSSDGEGDTIITMNGTTIEDEPTQNILELNISGGAATISVNFAGGDPLPVGGFYADVATVRLEGPHGSDALVTTSTAAMIGSDVIRYSPTTTLIDNLSSDGGVLAISGTINLENPAGDSLTVAPGATVYVNGSQTFSSLTIDAGATVRQISQNTTFGASVLTVGSLSLQDPDTSGNGGGILDLGYGDLIVRGGISPDVAGFGATGNTSQIEQWLAAGYDGGWWDGASPDTAISPACILSSVVADDPEQLATIGFSQIGTATGQLDQAIFDGVSVSDGDYIVSTTLRSVLPAIGTLLSANAGPPTAIPAGNPPPSVDHTTGGTISVEVKYTGTATSFTITDVQWNSGAAGATDRHEKIGGPVPLPTVPTPVFVPAGDPTNSSAVKFNVVVPPGTPSGTYTVTGQMNGSGGTVQFTVKVS
jgi:hypothetical protein